MDRGAWATAHGVTKELDVAEHTWAREQKHSPKTGPVMNLNRKGTRCQSTVPYGPARLLSPGFPVCFSLTASICQGKKKKKENDKDQYDWSKKNWGEKSHFPGLAFLQILFPEPLGVYPLYSFQEMRTFQPLWNPLPNSNPIPASQPKQTSKPTRDTLNSFT